MKEVEYIELLRQSQEIVLREEVIKVKAKTRDYILNQIKVLENKYQQKIEELVAEIQNLKLNYEQLQIKNQQYAQIILEQEYKSIQNKNYVSIEIVNQLLTQKIKQLLLKLKEHNIISELEFFNQQHLVDKKVADLYASNSDISLCKNIQQQQQLQIEDIKVIQKNSQVLKDLDEEQRNLIEKKETASQTKGLKKDAQRLKQSIIQKRYESKQQVKSLTPEITKEIFDFKKSIEELKKSKNNLENCNEYLKQQNKSLQMKLSQKQTPNKNFTFQQSPRIITKFLKFDDILFKQVSPFQMADSFDLRQKFPTNRTVSSRPRTSIPSTCRNRYQSQHNAYQILL